MEASQEQSKQYYPSEWHDDERMNILFNSLPRNDSSSSQALAARCVRINFWTAAIHRWTSATATFTFTLQEAQHAFARGNRVPQCLSEVIQHMIEQGSLCLTSELCGSGAEKEEKDRSWVVWGARAVAAPPNWLWTKLAQQLRPPRHAPQLLDVRLLQERSTHLYDEFWNASTKVTECKVTKLVREPSLVRSIAELHMEVERCVGGRAQVLHWCLRLLQRQGLAGIRERDGTTYVRLALPGQTLDPADPVPYTQTVEVEVAAAIERLQRRVEQLELEVTAHRLQAKQYINRGNKQQAVSWLRRSRRAAASLQRQLAALENTEACAHHLNDARTNRAVVAAFTSTALALKQLVSGDASALQVADIVDQLQETLQECDDVAAALSGGADAATDESELEEELNALLEERPEQEDATTLIQALEAVSIPSDSPATGSSEVRVEEKQRLQDVSSASLV